MVIILYFLEKDCIENVLHQIFEYKTRKKNSVRSYKKKYFLSFNIEKKNILKIIIRKKNTIVWKTGIILLSGVNKKLIMMKFSKLYCTVIILDINCTISKEI